MTNGRNYVDLGWCCVDVCQGLVQGLERGKSYGFSPFVVEEIGQFAA